MLLSSLFLIMFIVNFPLIVRPKWLKVGPSTLVLFDPVEHFSAFFLRGPGRFVCLLLGVSVLEIVIAVVVSDLGRPSSGSIVPLASLIGMGFCDDNNRSCTLRPYVCGAFCCIRFYVLSR